MLAVFLARDAQAFVDCNQNGLPDVCDIAPASASAVCQDICVGAACGASADCNRNGVPDECDVRLSEVPPSDHCSDAPLIGILPAGVFKGSTSGKDSDGSAKCASPGSNGSPSAYYAYRPLEDGSLHISTCGSTYNTLVSVHTGCPATPSREAACNDDSATCGKQSELEIQVKKGATYYIRLAGSRPKDSGEFQLELGGPASAVGSKDCDLNGVPDECQPDSDGDGIQDGCDNCLGAPNLAQLDTDSDGAGDACDQCPTDLSKSAPGQCGCGRMDSDSDGDGTADCIDQCPSDPLKQTAGICGCGVSDADSDSDGAPDCRDRCPSDPNKTEAGACGCGISDVDTDGDGTFDCSDGCIMDLNKIGAGVCGCGVSDIDTDRDGKADCIDECPLDPAKIQPGQCGCNVTDIDGDGDRTPDCHDLCPSDPKKTSPDSCGCGIMDTDSDGDGTPDCNDQCPSDPLKQARGVCGCGVDDKDSDGDGIADCTDHCPLDPKKLEAGVCGCGTGDTDSDHDGVPDCNDQCATDPQKNQHGVCGCGIADTDNDRDGKADCVDLCPADPNKSAPGQCGCGTSEADSDGDGMANCIDLCPSDASKNSPGTCGCGVSEIDSDGDGTPDCHDLCLSDPRKTAPGVCGCGNADTDSEGDGTPDCRDQCPSDSKKIEQGACGCGVEDKDANSDGVYDCICAGVCDSARPTLDEDGDGVTNCEELENNTRPCDRGSYIPRLGATACAGANGFFDQSNVLTLVNHLATPLFIQVQYRAQNGTAVASVPLGLAPLSKYDMVINDLGLRKDTIGSVCVTTNALEPGSWSGGVTMYKPRYNASGAVTSTYDFALNYPLANPQRRSATVPLNTNSVGMAAGGWVANWIRIADAKSGDGTGVEGSLRYYSQTGALLGIAAVHVADGGSSDFGGHEVLGQSAVGMAVFTPNSDLTAYYLTAARYFYEGPPTSKSNFYTAFTIPNRPPTGAPVTGRVSTAAGEMSVVELLNSSDSAADTSINSYELNGILHGSEIIQIPVKGTVHRIVDSSMLSMNTVGSARVKGPVEAVSAITVIYRFDSYGTLLFAYAPPFVEPVGRVQFTDFNTFIGNVDTLEVINTLDKTVSASVRVIDYAGVGFSFNLQLYPRAVSRTYLPPPLDRYGTIIVDSGADLGLIVRNDIQRGAEYLIPIQSR